MTVALSIPNVVALAAFLWNVALFARALRSGFIRPGGVPWLMRLMGVCAAIATLVDGAILLASNPPPFLRFLGSMILLGGSQWLFRLTFSATRPQPLSLAFSGDQPTHLNQRGPYRFLRHPFYTAYLLTWAGAVLATAHLAAIAMLGVLTVFYIIAAIQEERKFTKSSLASVYDAYRRTTGMFFPRLFSFSSFRWA